MTARIPRGTIVEYLGQRGVTVDDFMSCCSDDETPVVFDGEGAFHGIMTADLTVIGDEDAKADFRKCGAGQGAKCCIFLVGGSNGPECERHGEFRYTLIFKSGMTAQRRPVKPFPACQDLEDGNG